MLQSSWFKKESFGALKNAIEGLVASLTSYASYLQEKSKWQRCHNEQTTPSATPSESSHMNHLPMRPNVPTSLHPIVRALKEADVYTPVTVLDFASGDRRQRYRYVGMWV